MSAGNTGALMAIARFVLKTLPGIDRPAIASQLPTRKGVTTALDLGANVNCTLRAARAVRGDGQRAGDGRRGHRASDRRPPQHRRGGHQGQRRGEADRGAPEGARRSISTATSKATTSTRAPPTSSSATDSSATSRSRSPKGLVVMLYDFLKHRVHAQSGAQARGARRVSGAARVQEARRSAPLQRRHAGRAEGRRREEPRRRRRARLPHALRKAHAEVASGVLDKIAREIAAMPAAIVPAAIVAAVAPSRMPSGPRGVSGVLSLGRGARPAPCGRIAGTGRYLPADVLTNEELARASRPATNGFARAPASASGTSRAGRDRRRTSRCTRRARRSPPRA